MINPVHCLWAFGSAIAAGTANSIAGGGTLLTFPVLVNGCGLTEKIANATSTVGLVFASVSGALGTRHGANETDVAHASFPFFLMSFLGGAVGSMLLIYTPPAQFKAIVPWLILMAALIFLLHDTLSKYFIKPTVASPPLPGMTVVKLPAVSESDAKPAPKPMRRRALVFQFFVAVYGGYFGAGIGIMMLAALSLMRAGSIYRMNYLKNCAALVINGISSLLFIFWGLVEWPLAVSMAIGALIGGWSGAGLARKIGPRWTRRIVSIIGLTIAGWMMWNQFK